MKKNILLVLFLIICQRASTCPVCEKSQPRIFRGITHGIGPQSNWDFVIIAIVTIITTFCLYLSIWYLYKPGEKNINHIKNSIFNTTEYGR
ncbi:MAG: hypothetical protein ABIW38_06780 [Ferruginibacter sp.]